MAAADRKYLPKEEHKKEELVTATMSISDEFQHAEPNIYTPAPKRGNKPRNNSKEEVREFKKNSQALQKDKNPASRQYERTFTTKETATGPNSAVSSNYTDLETRYIHVGDHVVVCPGREAEDDPYGYEEPEDVNMAHEGESTSDGYDKPDDTYQYSKSEEVSFGYKAKERVMELWTSLKSNRACLPALGCGLLVIITSVVAAAILSAYLTPFNKDLKSGDAVNLVTGAKLEASVTPWQSAVYLTTPSRPSGLKPAAQSVNSSAPATVLSTTVAYSVTPDIGNNSTAVRPTTSSITSGVKTTAKIETSSVPVTFLSTTVAHPMTPNMETSSTAVRLTSSYFETSSASVAIPTTTVVHSMTSEAMETSTLAVRPTSSFIPSGLKTTAKTETSSVPLTFPTTIVGPCRNGWTEHDNHCYKLMTIKASWATANANCKLLDADLVSIQKQPEHKFLKGIITNAPKGKLGLVWIGAYLDGVDWKWTDVSPYSYARWAPGEPNYRNKSPGEICVGVYSKKIKHWWGWEPNKKIGAWNDVLCKEECPYVCKTPQRR